MKIIGIHSSIESPIEYGKTVKSADISEAVIRDVELYKLNAAQIFVYGPRFLKPNAINYEKLRSVTENIDLTVHSAYATTKVWSVNNSNRTLSDSKSILKVFDEQMLCCNNAGATAMVLHLPKLEYGIVAETMSILIPIAKKNLVALYLEMPAYKSDPDKTFDTPEKLDNLIAQIDKLSPDCREHYGITVDTAHLWGAGVDVSTKKSVDDWLERFVNRDMIKQIHLNGSCCSRGSGIDKHEIAFTAEDNIWGDVTNYKSSGLYSMVKFAYSKSIPIILEINRGLHEDVVETLNIIKSI